MSDIIIITSKFNFNITNKLYLSAVKVWREHYNASADPKSFWVPGAVELPLMASWVIDELKPSAIVCLGAVIRGESAHFDYVCQQASQGCQQVSLANKVPVIFGVLTVYDFNQALQRTGGLVMDSGKESMLAAIEMLANKEKLKMD